MYDLTEKEFREIERQPTFKPNWPHLGWPSIYKEILFESMSIRCNIRNTILVDSSGKSSHSLGLHKFLSSLIHPALLDSGSSRRDSTKAA